MDAPKQDGFLNFPVIRGKSSPSESEGWLKKNERLGKSDH